MNLIEGYVSAVSVSPGEVVDFHVRTEPPHSSFQIQIFRKLKVESLVHSGFGIADSFDTPTNAYEIGCGWPSAYTLTVPNDSSVVAQITDNVLRNLSSKRPLFPKIQNTAFSEWLDDSHPQDWVLEGSGSVSRDSQPRTSGASGLLMNAIAGQTWLIQGPFQCKSQRLYRIAGWVRSDRPGATLRLQSINTWNDFVVARHSGSGQWEYISAISKPSNEVDDFPARVKVEVTSGVIAQVEQVMVEIL